MNEHVTPLELSLKLKAEGAPHAFTDFYDGCHVWSAPLDGPEPTTCELLCDAYHDVTYADDDADQRFPLMHDGEYRLVARAFTPGELIELIADEGVAATLSISFNDHGSSEYSAASANGVFRSSVSAAEALGQLYLHILSQKTT